MPGAFRIRVRSSKTNQDGAETDIRLIKNGAADALAASHAVMSGENLPLIGKLLGYRRHRTTARYAHLARQSVKTVATRIADSLADNMDTPPGDSSTACPTARLIEMDPANHHRVSV